VLMVRPFDRLRVLTISVILSKSPVILSKSPVILSSSKDERRMNSPVSGKGVKRKRKPPSGRRNDERQKEDMLIRLNTPVVASFPRKRESRRKSLWIPGQARNDGYGIEGFGEVNRISITEGARRAGGLFPHPEPGRGAYPLTTPRRWAIIYWFRSI
jgi:hypothetical protein